MTFKAEESQNLKQRREADGRVLDVPRPNYQLYYHPNDWQLLADGSEIRPVFSHVAKEVGVGAVAANGNFDAEHLRLTKRGWVAIPHDSLGQQDYVVPYRNKFGKLVHRSIFQAGYATPEGGTQWTFDHALWSKFIRLLRKRGVVKPPQPAIIVGMARRAEAKMKHLLSRQPPRDSEPEKVLRWEKKLEATRTSLRTLERELDASIKRYGAPVSPASATIDIDALLDEAEEDDVPIAALRPADRAPTPVPPAEPAKEDLDLDDEFERDEEEPAEEPPPPPIKEKVTEIPPPRGRGARKLADE